MRPLLGLALGALCLAPARAAQRGVEAPRLPGLEASAAAPDARAVLARAAEAGLALGDVGAAIQGTTPLQTLDDMRERLVDIGALRAGEYESPGDAATLRELLQRLWFESAPSTPRLHGLEAESPVPALTVVNDGVTYHVHGLVHPPSGAYPAPRRSAVRRLVAGLAADGRPLVSESGLPALYGYRHGVEVLDEGARVELRAATPDPAVSIAQRAWQAAQAAAVAGPALAVALEPGQALAWAALAGGAWAAYLIHRSLSPALKSAWLLRSLVRAPWRAGGWRAVRAVAASDTGHHLRQWARAVFAARPAPDALRRVQLPLAPAAYLGRDWAYARRARALAGAAVAAARRSGSRDVHVITGFQHGEEVAGWLAAPRSPSPAGPGTLGRKSARP